MSTLDREQLRQKVRLKLVLKRGTQLARVYGQPAVREQTLAALERRAEGDSAFAPALNDYILMLGDSYRVLRTATGYAAEEFYTVEEAREDLVTRLVQAGEDSSSLEEIRGAVDQLVTGLEPFLCRQQALLDKMTDHAAAQGLVPATANRSLAHSTIRELFPSPDSLASHYRGWIAARNQLACELARQLDAKLAKQAAPGERLHHRMLADTLVASSAIEAQLQLESPLIYGA